jgi:hypothetical protein
MAQIIQLIIEYDQNHLSGSIAKADPPLSNRETSRESAFKYETIYSLKKPQVAGRVSSGKI